MELLNDRLLSPWRKSLYVVLVCTTCQITLAQVTSIAANQRHQSPVFVVEIFLDNARMCITGNSKANASSDA
jgi:hypothetical protein